MTTAQTASVNLDRSLPYANVNEKRRKLRVAIVTGELLDDIENDKC